MIGHCARPFRESIHNLFLFWFMSSSMMAQNLNVSTKLYSLRQATISHNFIPWEIRCWPNGSVVLPWWVYIIAGHRRRRRHRRHRCHRCRRRRQSSIINHAMVLTLGLALFFQDLWKIYKLCKHVLLLYQCHVSCCHDMYQKSRKRIKLSLLLELREDIINSIIKSQRKGILND